MLFNSPVFLFAFLPITLAVFLWLGSRGLREWAIGWLVVASLFFYGWWNPVYVLLILASIGFNYAVGARLASVPNRGLMSAAVVANLGFLAYFKYANFFVDSMNAAVGSEVALAPIALPLAISFFTFQQITYIVDANAGLTREYDFLRYCLFVTFFPQLIAGPIVHHTEMLPQFAAPETYRPRSANLVVGLTIFVIGLFKKVVIADSIALRATPVFDAALAGGQLGFFEAWGGALAYTLQLYFDFSGYSDMAIGLGYMIGVRLPYNFDSPYKSRNIIEFWRRWHMTLSRFLRDYVYFPLGGNRRGRPRRYVNLLITMLLGGLWHGAAWTFVVWGALHGALLVVNHAWHALRSALGLGRDSGTRVGRAVAVGVTFLAVVVGWVIFRAESFGAAASMLSAMSGTHGVVAPAWLEGLWATAPAWVSFEGTGMGAFGSGRGWVAIACLLGVVWFCPNSQQLVAQLGPRPLPVGDTEPGPILWRDSPGWAVALGLLAGVSVLHLTRVSEFLYFQF